MSWKSRRLRRGVGATGGQEFGSRYSVSVEFCVGPLYWHSVLDVFSISRSYRIERNETARQTNHYGIFRIFPLLPIIGQWRDSSRSNARM